MDTELDFEFDLTKKLPQTNIVLENQLFSRVNDPSLFLIFSKFYF